MLIKISPMRFMGLFTISLLLFGSVYTVIFPAKSAALSECYLTSQTGGGLNQIDFTTGDVGTSFTFKMIYRNCTPTVAKHLRYKIDPAKYEPGYIYAIGGVSGVYDPATGYVTYSDLTNNSANLEVPIIFNPKVLTDYVELNHDYSLNGTTWIAMHNSSPDGNGTANVSARLKTATMPPLSAPVITGQLTADGFPNIFWSAVPRADGYEVYRNGVAIGQSVSDQLIDFDAPIDVAVNYTVKAYQAGVIEQSPFSNSVTLTRTVAVAPPPAGGTGGGLNALTQRDYHLISMGLASLVGWFTIKQFRWRSYD